MGSFEFDYIVVGSSLPQITLGPISAPIMMLAEKTAHDIRNCSVIPVNLPPKIQAANLSTTA